MRRARTTTLLLTAALLLGATGCSNDTNDDTTAAEDTDGDMDEMEDGDHEDEDADHDEEAADHDEAYAFGEPAEAADADRTIEVDANDDLTYGPATIEVAAGETITFAVTNTGQAVHEFTLGDAATQEAHEAEMQEMMADGEAMMHDEPNTLSLEAGEAGELTWHFTEAGSLEFACHQPGHYAGGMVGTLEVT